MTYELREAMRLGPSSAIPMAERPNQRLSFFSAAGRSAASVAAQRGLRPAGRCRARGAAPLGTFLGSC